VLLGLCGCRKPALPVKETPRAGAAWTNSIGMRFVPIPGLRPLVSVYETRAAEFDLFVKETQTAWVPPDAERGAEYPAANVTWDDAVAFCAWLTERERAAGTLGPKQRYRLPADVEWTVAAFGGTKPAPSAPSRYVWGDAWPPPLDAGNFAGEEARVDQTEPNNFVAGRKDAYPQLSPVGKFAANGAGLYDLAGNVLEWCEDRAEDQRQGRIARGGSWLNGDPETLAIEHRAVLPPRAGLNVVGFRCVLEVAE
jgi:formylglycine-generating enzyme required for sulfatase activity